MTIRNSLFHDQRGWAVVGNGTGCAVLRCEVRETGCGGISLGGGNRRTLTPGSCRVEDCLIHDFGKLLAKSDNGIRLSGVGQIIRHNEIFGASGQVVGIYGNDHLFEYNVISNVCWGTDDAGALYKGRNPSCTGNMYRYNLWCDIGRPDGHGTAAIYFDDGDSGETVYGNVFVRAGSVGGAGFGSVFVNGGMFNHVENCLFVDCGRPLGHGYWDQKRWIWSINVDTADCPVVTRLRKEIDVTRSPYPERYPWIRDLLKPHADEDRWNTARANVFVNCVSAPGGRWRPDASNVSVTGDVGFVDAPARDWRLKSDSRIYREAPAFRPIPFEKIGRRMK